ncbi:cytochrome c family protein [Caulobacter sp. 17J80-11]|uniref:c-type cytochrome n=1 Tax=Caulobacter sp. 17J80-11 TaxID=2763502 RepID=UPI001653BC00|nr:cytochrome c family protein [Caulobacter sp. 17J80-11]MBC6982730.1 cytochrome c family protein [Caulobacter sp. 17J80-11]
MRRPALLVLAASAAMALSACGPKQEKTAEAPAAEAPAPSAAPIPVPPTEDQAKILATFPAPYNTADLANGKRVFARCRSCHSLTEGGPNMTGPNLYGVFGRKAGSKADYNYSDAVKNAGFTWDAQRLDGWLSDPKHFLPGTKMSFAGVHDAKDRTDLIAYLMTETGHRPG